MSQGRTFHVSLSGIDRLVVQMHSSEETSFTIQYEAVTGTDGTFVQICVYASTDTGYVRLTRLYKDGTKREEQLTAGGDVSGIDRALLDLGANWQRYRSEY